MLRKFSIIALLISLGSGCSNLKTYPDNYAKNVFVNTRVESGSAFSSVKSRIDIFDVDKSCQAIYVGSVNLDKIKKEVGLKNNNLSYLDFRFLSSGFLSSSSSSTSFPVLLKIRKDYIYDVSVNYVDDLYSVEIWEKRSRKSKGTEVGIVSLADCQKL